MHWFEKTYVFGVDGEFKETIVFWKRQVDDIFFCLEGHQKGFKTVCLEAEWF